MDSVKELLATLASRGIRLSVEDGKLNCYAPRDALTDELKARIARNKSDLLVWLTQAQTQTPSVAAVSGPTDSALRSDAEIAIPMSVGAQALHLIQKLEPESTIYNVPLCVRLTGPVNADLMLRAWDSVLDRHPILSARVVERESAHVLVASHDCRSQLVALDCSTMEEDRVIPALIESARRPFDLERGPLVRIELHRRSVSLSYLMLVVHHVIFDGHSGILLMKSLLDAYRDLLSSNTVRPAAISSGYADHVMWEQAMLSSPEGAKHAAYWKRQLQDASTVLRIADESTPPHAETAAGDAAVLARVLDEACSRRIRSLAADAGVAVSTVFLAAFAEVLRRHSGEDDIVVSMPVSVRNPKLHANAIGYFVNLVPLRVSYGDEDDFGSAIRSVQRTMLDGLYHSVYPFALMDGVAQGGDARGDSRFGITYAYQDFVRDGDFSRTPGEPGPDVELVTDIFQQEGSDLGLQVFDRGDAFVLRFSHLPGRYGARLVERVFVHLQQFLESLGSDRGGANAMPSMLAPEERDRLLHHFNRPQSAITPVSPDALFAEAVEAYADRTAIVSMDRRLSYRQLDRDSLRLAQALQQSGVTSGTVVGLCAERSVEAVVGLLAILRCGGCFFPLDPAHTRGRLADMIRDSGTKLVLAQPDLMSAVEAIAGEQVRVVALDGSEALPDTGHAIPRLPTQSTEVQPACLIYATGSIGDPRGVLLAHKGLVNQTLHARELYGIGPQDAQLQLSGIGSGLFLQEVFATLNSGARLVIQAGAETLSPAQLQASIAEHGLSVLNIPTAMFHALAAAGARLSGLRCVIVGGGKLDHGKAQAFLARNPDIALYNTYGATETSIVSTAMRISPEALLGREFVPIGKPIPNTTIRILDRHRNLQPIGAPGELCIAGAGLALGYHGRSELTLERFVEDPFLAGARMYRTGDLARWLEDGSIEYLGRIDRPATIRASRPESGRTAETPNDAATDAATAQGGRLCDEALKRQREYWRRRLQGAPELLELPTDRARPAAQSYRSSDIEVELPVHLVDRLHALSRRHDATLFVTLLTSWSALLSRLSRQNEVVIGSPAPSRAGIEAPAGTGWPANLLALRVDAGAERTVPQLLAQVKETLLGAHAHGDLPFDHVVEAVQPVLSPSYSPVFQTVFALDAGCGHAEIGLWGLSLTAVKSSSQASRFDLSLLLRETDRGLVGSLRYAVDLFDRSTMDRLLESWATLLEGMVADDSQPIHALPLLSTRARQQILHAFNATAVPYPRDRCVHAVFEDHVRSAPDAVALIHETQSLTYRELNRRANIVAHRLIALGVKPEDRVAICADRSVDMVVGLLGVLKAGGGYVPLDPTYPRERLEYILEDSAPIAVLTQTSLKRDVPWLSTTSMPVLLLEDMKSGAAHEEADPHVADLGSRHLAYVIYTSGSTGRPKGVMVEHRNILNLALNNPYATIPGNACSTHCSNPAFDASVWEIWGGLLNGHRLLIVSQEALLSPESLSDMLVREGVVSLFLTTGLFNQYAASLKPALRGMKYLMTGGDVIDMASVDHVLGEPDASVRLVNCYGPTEATTYATTNLIDSLGDPRGDASIGRPIANARIYILDEHGAPVPIGVAGEIHIGGAGVARGYLNRPDLTAERFVKDPFNADSDARIYKTGDLGRWLPDGRIEYLGRNDFQVKIRGFRIELGEIESKLQACAGVREAVVLAREDVPGEKRLVGYVVMQPGQTLSVSGLREQLQRDLPEYMVPAMYVGLERLPLTPNGKVDRKGLPAPEQGEVAQYAYEAPSGDVEEAIAAIWRELLGLERVGREDHFFELGGHSLLALRLSTRVRTSLGVEISPREIFAHPSLRDLSAVVSGGARTQADTIVRADRSGTLPLSWSQQRLWFLDQLDHAAGAAYHIPAALRLEGALDVAALKRSLDGIVRRHEVLRTRFVSEEGVPRQQIGAETEGFQLDVVDLRDLDEDARAMRVRELSAEEARAPFDLSRGPLIRGRLLRLGTDAHVLLVTQHHIVSDGWSIEVLIREVSALYGAYSRGEQDPLPELPIQYADYAAWQRDWLSGDVLEGQLGYWRAHLQGAPGLLELPTDRPRPAVQSYRGAEIEVVLPEDLRAGLQALSLRHGVTLFMTLLASWSALLSRLSGQDEVVIGSPVANRQRSEVEGLIGFFVNTLALRVDVGSAGSVTELLAQVKETTLGAYTHQDLPFEQVVEALQPVRSLSHSPMFQAMLTLNNTSFGDAMEWPGVRLSPIRLDQQTAQFDLSLSLTDANDRVAGELIYATDLFDRATVERLLGHWMSLLAGMVADDSQPIHALPLLSAQDRHRILEAFNANVVPYARGRCMHSLFEEQVRAAPDAAALVYETQSLSYSELNRRANIAAHRLIALGVKPEDRVAICTDRSVELVVGLLGVLKAGAGYVPLDPTYPRDRLEYMLEDSAPVAVLTQAALRHDVPWLSTASMPVLTLEEMKSGTPDEETDPNIAGLGSHHLAYVIYTSGSTGRPKGVMVEHQGLCNLAAAQVGLFDVRRDSHVLQFASMSFDASIFELVITLCSGACLHMASKDSLRPGDPLLETLRRERITHVTLPPTALVTLPKANIVGSEMTLILAGEALPPTARDWAEHNRLFNAYGPTEATICATAYLCPAGHGAHAIPIGGPIANTRIYILDSHGAPVPIGVPGEIHIGGAGVARGYLNRPDLTAERFFPDPFSADTDARMYRTGDLGRWLPDGNIEYLGRNDFQVKIRGFRIELGEIESRLQACAGVREAVVLAREDVPGEKRLVGYVVMEEGNALSVSDLREQLQRDLPDYMVPAMYVALDRLPLSPNGKVDRKGLPAPEQGEVARRAYEAPQGEVEEAIAGIWCELLGLDRVGREDHFFDLGGHSLLAVRLVTRVRTLLGREVSPREVFSHPSLRELSAAVSAGARTQTGPIGRVDRSGALPLSWSQQRLWFLDQLDHAAGAAYQIPAALRLEGALDVAALRRSLDRIVYRHEVLRTRFVSEDGVPRQEIGPESEGFHLEELDLSDLGEEARAQRVQALIVEEADAPFDMSRGPLIRGRLLKLKADEHVLLMTQHHIVSDGWSIGVLIQEVSALYGAYSRGEADPLPALPIQYVDYAAWQRDWLSGDVLEEQIGYWRQRLQGAPGLLELPTDRPRPAVQSYRGAKVDVQLPADLLERVHALSRRHGATLFMTLLASWSAVLSRLSGQDEVVIGSPVANRQRSEVEGLIGFFVNTLVLRVDLGSAQTVSDLLAQVKETTLGAYTHQDLPFEQVVEAVQPARSLSYSPLFQAMLSLNNTSSDVEGMTLPGVRLSPIETAHESAHFDLSLSLNDTGDAIAGAVVYATDLFERPTVERLVGYWTTLLEGMTEDDARPVHALPLLPSTEREQVVEGFNATARPYPQDRCVHALFEEQAARTPSADAVEYDSDRLTYAELNRRANVVAHRLIGLGVKPDDRVAVCTERSVEMVVGLLAVMKAGGAYVPLDPFYPADRLAYMLEDSAPVAVLTQAALRTQSWLSSASVPVLCLEEWVSGSAVEEANPQVPGLTSDRLAYVIYTSGSTGRPKGVMVEHRSAVNFWQVMRETTHRACAPHSRVGLNAAFSFDMSLKGLLQLLSGHCVVVIPQETRLSGPALLSFLEERRIDALDSTPSQLEGLLSAGLLEEGVYRPVSVLLGGEPIGPAMWEKLKASRVVGFHNMYGPTECTVDATIEDMSRTPGGPVIGRPLGNARVYILDAQGAPVPIGVSGEIHIGGAGVARGYLDRPELTAERFVRDPFSTQPDARMYKTGDLGRWLPNGAIEYLGRNDFQVKIRGFRIELGEIEAKMQGCAGVREALVLAREDVPGEKRLVGYVVPEAGETVSASSLREWLKRELPEYMVPSLYVMLERMPLTPNGKVDRKALPPPEYGDVSQRAYEAPLGEAEEALAGIWCELLGLERVGRDDEFFELGGHSLLAMRVVTRVRSQLGVEISLREVFAQPSLRSLGAVVSAGARSREGVIGRADRSGSLPLSWSQQRLWFLDQLDHAAGAAYHVPAALRLEGDLDVGALRRSLDRIVQRHEVLRTRFVSEAGVARQEIGPEQLGFALVERDLGHLGAEVREEQVRALSAEEARRPFDLSRGPLIRGQLLRLGDREHVLLVTQHHIVSDGWSIGVLVREVSALYGAYSRGEADPLPALPIQYADYASWQREWLSGDVLEGQLGYWRERLSGAPGLLDLPTDRPRPAVQSYRGAELEVTLSADLLERLNALSRRHGVTLFMTLLAGWSVLLSRVSGQDEVVIGTPVANRQRSELEGLIGFFVNTLALRVDVGGGGSVSALLGRVKETTLGAYAHQDLPFEQVVEAVQPMRSLSHSPVFQAMLSLNNTSTDIESLTLSGIRLSPIGTAHQTAQFDLSLALRDTGDAIVGAVVYATDLFERSTVERLLGYWTTLLEGMTEDDARPVHALPLLGAEERHQVLVAFNDTAMAYPRDGLIHGLFEAQVARSPEATALVYRDQALSYAELNRRANVVAHRLIGLGVKPDDRVAICADRSVEMVVGLLGALKAGGGYVPLDPTYPQERLAYMLEDSAPVAVLTQSALRSTQSWLSSASTPVLCLEDWVSGSAEEETNPQVPGLGADRLAYVIYTSGSTGRPKGVMIEHTSTVNLLAWAEASFTRSELAQMLLSTSVNFDLAVFELFLPLSMGGTVRLVRNLVTPGWSLEGTTLVNTVPSAIAAVLDAGEVPATVETVNLAGEALKRELVERIFAESGVGAVANLYGPSETTTYSTWVRMPRSGGFVPHIGRPIANTQVYILDAHGAPVPIGVSGEIYIGGAGVARGYLNRPDLTAERFLADPFSAEAGARMYRTGDLGRWLPDGNIEYLGRNDFQVKIRGFRIELGEIESKLLACAGVREAVVLAREDVPGEKRLVGYVVPESDEAVSVSSLRESLQRELPEYMVPSLYVMLERMPLTPNGKVDRKGLPSPEYGELSQRAYEAPQGEVEGALAQIWRELLGLERVGRDDDFFELGGHSLLALRIMAKAKERFGRLYPMTWLFSASTIRRFAALVESDSAATHDILVPMEVRGNRTPIFAIAGAGGNVMSLIELSRSLGPDQPFYGLQAQGLDGRTPPSDSIETTARINIQAIKSVQPEGPYRLLGHSYGGAVAYEMALQLSARGDRVSMLALLDSGVPSLVRMSSTDDERALLQDILDAVAPADGPRIEFAAEDGTLADTDIAYRNLVAHGVGIERDQFDTLLDVLKSNLSCYRRYQPSPMPVEIDVRLFRATREDHRGWPEDHGWTGFLRSPPLVHAIDAGHHTILRGANARAVADLLQPNHDG